MPFTWLTPLIYHALGGSVVILVLAFTPPNSLIRPALFPLLFTLTLYILPLIRDTVPRKVQASFLVVNSVGFLLQYLDFGLISRWSLSARGPTTSRGGQRNANLSLADRKTYEQGPKRTSSSFWMRLQWGLFAATAWRAPATPWEVKNTPPFDRREPKRLPTRARFLLDNALTLVLCFLVIDLSSFLGGGLEKAKNNPVDFAWHKVGFFARLNEISAAEIAERFTVILMCWVVMYCTLQVFYCSVAIVAVVSRVSTIEVWPPLFGSVKEAYSIRQFWGAFWHQALRQKLGSPAYYATYSLLGLRKGGPLARYTCILLTFTISGLAHVAEEYGAGVPLNQGGSMRFYCIQALGILLEDAAKAAAVSFSLGTHRRWGYVWVVLWMVWSSPAWFYPKIQNNDGSERNQILPFSLLGLVLRKDFE